MAFERPWVGDPFNRLKVLAPPHLLSADKVRELGVLDGQLFRSLTVPTGSLQKLQAQPLLAGTESITPLKRAGYLTLWVVDRAHFAPPSSIPHTNR